MFWSSLRQCCTEISYMVFSPLHFQDRAFQNVQYQNINEQLGLESRHEEIQVFGCLFWAHRGITCSTEISYMVFFFLHLQKRDEHDCDGAVFKYLTRFINYNCDMCLGKLIVTDDNAAWLFAWNMEALIITRSMLGNACASCMDKVCPGGYYQIDNYCRFCWGHSLLLKWPRETDQWCA